MIPISNELNESLSDDNQIVRPKVLAWMSDLRALDNLKAHSSSHTYEKQVLDRNPQMYVKFDKTDYSAAKEISNCLTVWTSYGGPLNIESTSHGLSAGDEVVFSTNSSTGLPYESVPSVPYTGGLQTGELHFYNRFYVQNPSTHYFNINTDRANAIANSATGRVVRYGGGATIGLAGITLTVGPKATFTYASHGYSNGDAVVFTTYGGTIPGGMIEYTSSTIDSSIYYIQNSTANTFNLNTSYANAIANISDGMVETTSNVIGTLYSYTVHQMSNNIQGGHRVKDYGQQAFDIAIGTSDAGVPIHDQSLVNTYHDTFANHIEILEPNRLIDTFNNKGLTTTLTNAFVSKASQAIVTYNLHGLTSGTSVMFSNVGSLLGINTTTTYYVDVINANTFYLNTSYVNSINKVSTGRVNTSTSAAGGNTTILVYNEENIGFFTKQGSSDSTNSDMSYYSWDRDNNNWIVVGNQLTYKDSLYNNNMHYVNTNVSSLDHFVDFKVGVNDQRGSAAFVRFVDDLNFIRVQYASPSYSNPIAITCVVNGKQIGYYEVPGASLSSFSSGNYYRFQAKGNLFLLYDMGGTEPSKAPGGTLVGSTYFDHPIFKTEEAKKCGLGFSYKALFYPMAEPGDVVYRFDYFAAYGYNSLSNFYYFNYDNATSSQKKYLYSSTSLNAAKTSQFQALNNAQNFSYSFYLYKQPVTYRRSTIFWLGNQSRETALRVSYQEADEDLIVVEINSESTTYTLSSIVSSNTLYHVAIIKNGTRLSLYINNSEVAYTTLPDTFTLKDIVTGETPFIMFGGDYAGTTLGDPSGYHLAALTYISEFAMFDYALSSADINAMYYSVANGATLASETSDDYCNAECIIDGQPEETFSFAFTNMLNNLGNEIKAGNSIYAPNPIEAVSDKTSIEDNYGWMSRVQSDSSGNFLNLDYVQLTFDAAKCNKIFVSTGYLNGGISSFNYTLTKSDNSTISGSNTFDGSSFVFITASDLGLAEDEYLTITSVKITPTSTNNPYDYARIFSINPIWEVDLSDYVISFSVEKIRDNYDASLPIGATAANNGAIVFDNTDRVFNMFGDTLYGAYTTPDVPFFISFNHELTKYQTTEEIVLANEVYADTWSFNNSSMTTEVTFRDYSKYVQEKTVDGYVGQGISAGRAIMDLMLASGFPRRKVLFIDKYDDVISLDDPILYFPFNDTAEQLIEAAGGGSSAAITGSVDGLSISVGLEFITLGKTLLYSEVIDIQDEAQRKAISSIQSTFEPYYKQGSMKDASIGFFGWSSNDIFGNSNESWTTELFHYIDMDNFSSFNTELQLIRNRNPGGISPTPIDNYKLYFEVSGTEVTYTWGFYDTSDVEHRIVSQPFDVNIPHQIVVRKTGGTPNTFELFVDAVLQDSMSPDVSIKNISAAQYFRIHPDGEDAFISNLSIYDYAIPDQSIVNHYISGSVSIVPPYRYLYASDETYWDAMLNIATADLGMFYIDEYGFFRYEYRNFIHESFFDRYQNSQYTFSDDTNIIAGNYINEVQTNKISVSVKKISVEGTSTAQLWSASDGESLVTSTVVSNVTPESSSIPLASTTDPYWLPTGYVKIDDEIIKYNNIVGNSLSSLERGYFGTAASWHSTGSLAREAKYYPISYSSKPAAEVKYPLITNADVEIDKFSSNASGCELIISVKDNVAKDTIYLLSGTNDLTGLRYVFSIAGIPVSTSSSEEVVSEVVSEFLSNIRRYGVKELKIDNPFIQNKEYAKIISDYILGYYKEPIRVLEMETLAVPHIQLGDLVTISQFEDLGIINKKYWVVSNSLNYDGGIKQSLSLRAYSDTIDPPEFVFGSTSVPYSPPGGYELYLGI